MYTVENSIFIDNKYTRWYFSIIASAKQRSISVGYMEKHHIIPKALGGNNNIANIVNLSAKEHFIVHHLLTKMLADSNLQGKMWSAFFLMHLGHAHRVTYARTYELAKKQMSIHKSVITRGENNPFYGKTHNTTTKQKMSSSWNKEALRNHDTSLYTFYNVNHGEYRCTRNELCKQFNLHQKDVWKIVHKVQKTTKGWSIIWEKDQIS